MTGDCYSFAMTSAAPAQEPQVLVADDDPVSLQFLASALRELDCEVTAVANGTAVLAACKQGRFDLLLLDRRMPDLGGVELLHRLRERGCDVIAIATSAELNADMRSELTRAGYVEALTKPIGIDRLERLLAERTCHWRTREVRATSTHAASASALLDDGAGLASVGGDAKALRALRGLLMQELNTSIARIATMQTPMLTAELRDYLHRLRASCRYCGTPLLGAVAERLDAKLRADDKSIGMELDEFIASCAQTSAALAAQVSPETP